ncbi:MAG: zinc ribbon domain-containing protein [Candidatus Helarchaeota archaeon]|nr:zinc ribbon domain-containing protein [Candidatus Helarchaeota archaeon]
MASDTDHLSPETYQKLVTLSESMVERNNIGEILSEIKRKKSIITPQTVDVLTNKFLSKIALIDKQLSRVATGLTCSVCQKKLSLNDAVLACLWCGSPAHKRHLLKQVKTEGYCPACGEYLKVHFRRSIRTITHDLFKTCVNAINDKVHKLEVIYGDKLLQKVESGKEILCPECKGKVAADWKFCRLCGTRIEHKTIQEVEMRICPRCGRQIKSTWRFCKMCGHPLSRI